MFGGGGGAVVKQGSGDGVAVAVGG